MNRFPNFLLTFIVAFGLGAGQPALSQTKSASTNQGGGARTSLPTSTWSNKSSLAPASRSLWDRSQPLAKSASVPPVGRAATPAPAPASGGASSGGYVKPGMTASAPPAAFAPAPSPPSSPSGTAAPSSGGYSKPALGGVVASAPVTAPAPAPAPVAAPALAPVAAPALAPVAGVGSGGLPSSVGYAKPVLPGGGGGAAAPASVSPAPSAPSVAAQAPAAQAPAAQPPTGGFDKAVARQQSSDALARYRQDQQRFSGAPQGTTTGMSDYANNPLYKGNAGRYQSYEAAYDERDRWRGSHSWQPPAYAYRSAPSFGLWDALFWWMVLDKITEPSHAAAAYHNVNDPGFQAWRREADRMAQDNAELKAKLAVMDQKISGMQGTPQKPGTLPTDVPPAIAMAPAVMVAPRDKGLLAMGTGAKAGHYFPFCQGEGVLSGLRGAVQDLKVQCVETNGSVENLDGLAAGKFDAIMVQSDVFNDWMTHHPGVRLDALKATLYQEYVQVLANRKSGVESFSDLDPAKHTLYLVGSGAQRSWDSFAARVPALRAFDSANRLRRVPNDPGVLETVAGNPNGVLIFISGLNSDLLREADKRFGDKLLMALVSDSRIDSVKDPAGHSVYAYAKIPSGLYPKLQQSRWFGLTSSVSTLSVGAVFVLSERWVTENGVRSLGKVEEALWKVIPEMEKRVGVGG